MSPEDVDVGALTESHGSPEAVELEDLSAGATGIATFSHQTVIGPPIDGGYLAWRLLLSAFVFESLLWGFPVGSSVNFKYIPPPPGSLLTHR
jgi:hypothetical protein